MGAAILLNTATIYQTTPPKYAGQPQLAVAIVALFTSLLLGYQMYGPNKLADRYAVKMHAQVLYTLIFAAQTVVFFLSVTF